jgi:hypothetical protein
MTRDFGDLFSSPPAFFLFCCKQRRFLNRPLGLPCVTIGRPLRDPCVTQGSPKPNPRPNRNRQRVATHIPRGCGDSRPSPWLSIRISKHLDGCIPDHSNLAWVSALRHRLAQGSAILFWLFASCQMLAAQFSKTNYPHRRVLAWRRCSTVPFVRLCSQEKSGYAWGTARDNFVLRALHQIDCWQPSSNPLSS